MGVRVDVRAALLFLRDERLWELSQKCLEQMRCGVNTVDHALVVVADVKMLHRSFH